MHSEGEQASRGLGGMVALTGSEWSRTGEKRTRLSKAPPQAPAQLNLPLLLSLGRSSKKIRMSNVGQCLLSWDAQDRGQFSKLMQTIRATALPY